MRSLRVAVLAALAVLAAGCGAAPADLFVVQRTGEVPGADLDMLVSDGSIRCNEGPKREISSGQVLEGRAIATGLKEITQDDIPPAEPQIFGFEVRSEAGRVRFADTTTRPEVLPRLVLFVRRLAREVCGLAR
jgi:hypothetical protein